MFTSPPPSPSPRESEPVLNATDAAGAPVLPAADSAPSPAERAGLRPVVRGPRPAFSPDGASLPRPPWLRARMPGGGDYNRINRLIRDQRLHTVCKSANCPNVGECWQQGTATFMINGDVCTRSCTFCNIKTGRPTSPLDPDEPRRVAEAAAAMNLEHVVVTSVNRDEAPDGGAGQFAAVIREIRARLPRATIEVLIPDFKGDPAALDLVFRARPDVLNHNVETVPRLYREVRPQANYRQSLDVLRAAAAAGLVAKSGFMLGLGETFDEIEGVLQDLREAGAHLVTIGQYLRPTPIHHPITRYATPEEFDHWREYGIGLGFANVDSGPLVRSSYHAKGSFNRARGG